MAWRTKIGVLALAAVLILGLSLSQALAANNVIYLGKTTWTAQTTDDTNPAHIGQTITVTGGISKVGDEFYQFQGYVIPPGEGPFVMSGAGFLNGNNLEFTLSESQQHTDSNRDGGVMHIIVDKSTLNGTYYDIGHDFNTSTRTFDERYTAGTLTLSGSPIPLNVALPPANSLLLQQQ